MLMNGDGNVLQTKTLKKRFLVYVKDFLKSIEVDDISFFYFEEKVTYVITTDGKKYMMSKSLNQLEGLLDKDLFFRINRMFIVSYDSIGKIEPYFGNRLIVFLNQEFNVKAVVSREKVSGFKNWLDQ